MKNNDKITVPGFLAHGVSVGIKNNGKPDLSLIFSERPAQAAGVFTTNCFKAAPVLLSRERLRSGRAQAILTNSGNANAATGEEGYARAVQMAGSAASALGIDEDLVLVGSTGIIGHPLPIEKIHSGMPGLVAGLSPDGIPRAEEAIMTTDRFPKIAWRREVINGKEVTICGIAKGAGMIQPNMATMLTYLLTDAWIEGQALEKAFRYAVDHSFNAITVDGCMSTNDTALILANGEAGNRPLGVGTASWRRFRQRLTEVMTDLARDMVRDGEGATKVSEIVVEQAASLREAKRIAFAVGNANLVKAAFFGKDPNWGRIISAAGSIGIDLPVREVKLWFEDVLIFANGGGQAGQEKRLAEIMTRDEIRITLQVGRGSHAWRIFASDLTFDYVEINSHYST
jgi:glutamate N-acetyltransferase/amino-acid N-acetyltransferase